MHRVLMAGTVEGGILQLQGQKRALVDAAVSEEGASYTGRLVHFYYLCCTEVYGVQSRSLIPKRSTTTKTKEEFVASSLHKIMVHIKLPHHQQ